MRVASTVELGFDGRYSHSDDTIKNLWKVLKEFTPQQRCRNKSQWSVKHKIIFDVLNELLHNSAATSFVYMDVICTIYQRWNQLVNDTQVPLPELRDELPPATAPGIREHEPAIHDTIGGRRGFFTRILARLRKVTTVLTYVYQRCLQSLLLQAPLCLHLLQSTQTPQL